MKKILPISVIIVWGLFLWIDKLWNEVIGNAVSAKLGTYGELFGPLSFFRPVVLYLAFFLTLWLVAVYIKKKK